MQKIIYHLHDVCCNHSTLTLDDAVKYSLEHGYKQLYWTEHCPVSVKCGYQHRRAPFFKIVDLKKRIDAYNKQYKNKLHIYFGYEIEFNKKNRGYFEKIARDPICEFLILGIHFYGDIFKEPGPYDYCMNDTHSIKYIKEYLEMNKAGLESGLISGAPHPEIGLNSGCKGDKNAINASKEIINNAIKYKMPLGFDINFKSYETKTKGHYPCSYFGKLVAKTNIPVIIECDAHCLDKMTVEGISKGRKLAHSFGIDKNIVSQIPINGLPKKPLLVLYEKGLNKFISPSMLKQLKLNNVPIVEINEKTNLVNLCKQYKVHPVGTIGMFKKTSLFAKAKKTSMFIVSNFKGSDLGLKEFSHKTYSQFLKSFIKEV